MSPAMRPSGRWIGAGALSVILPALAQPLDLVTELHGLELGVEVIELDVDRAGPGLESGEVAVMVSNRHTGRIACQLHPGRTEADPGLASSPIAIIVPGERAVLRMRGSYGDDTLDARLSCRPDD